MIGSLVIGFIFLTLTVLWVFKFWIGENAMERTEHDFAGPNIRKEIYSNNCIRFWALSNDLVLKLNNKWIISERVSFYHDLALPLMLASAGIYYCYKKGTDGMIFAAINVVLAVYFAGWSELVYSSQE